MTGCGRGVVFGSNTLGTYPTTAANRDGWQEWSGNADARFSKYSVYYYYETEDSGGAPSLQDKRIWIRVRETGREDSPLLLDDELFFRCCDIGAYVRWQQFDTLEVDLIEQGHEYETEYASANGTYSVELARNGPRRLALLTYVFDKQQGRFVRSRVHYPPQDSIGATSAPLASSLVVDRAEARVRECVRGGYTVDYRNLYDAADRSVELPEAEEAFRDAVSHGGVLDAEEPPAWFKDNSTGELIAQVTFGSPGGDPLVIYVLKHWETKLTGVKHRDLVKLEAPPD